MNHISPTALAAVLESMQLRSNQHSEGWNEAIRHIRNAFPATELIPPPLRNEYGHAETTDFGTSPPEDIRAHGGPDAIAHEFDRRPEHMPFPDPLGAEPERAV